MDTITQITLGAAIGELTLGRKVGNKAVLWGGVAGLIPDLDILPAMLMNPVQRMAFHRSVTHSLLFAALWAPLMAYFIYRLNRNLPVNWREWVYLTFWSTVTHPLLDCFTAYGTQLFWPFSRYRIAWNTIFVIDPFYSVPFALSVLAVLFLPRTSRKRFWIHRVGLILSTLYLMLTVANKLYVTHQFREQLNAQHIPFTELRTGPTPLNNLLWRGVALGTDGFYTGYYTLLNRSDSISFRFTPAHHDWLNPYRSNPEVQTLLWITGNFYAVEKQNGALFIQDMRYGRLFGWAAPNAPYIFSFRLEADSLASSRHVHLIRVRPPLRFHPAALKALWYRIQNRSLPDSLQLFSGSHQSAYFFGG